MWAMGFEWAREAGHVFVGMWTRFGVCCIIYLTFPTKRYIFGKNKPHSPFFWFFYFTFLWSPFPSLLFSKPSILHLPFLVIASSPFDFSLSFYSAPYVSVDKTVATLWAMPPVPTLGLLVAVCRWLLSRLGCLYCLYLERTRWVFLLEWWVSKLP